VNWDLDNDGAYDDAVGNPISATLPAGNPRVVAQVVEGLESCTSNTTVAVNPPGAPLFAGVQAVSDVSEPGFIALRIEWTMPTEVCGGGISAGPPVFNVYRWGGPDFTPSWANLLRSCVTTTFMVDATALPSTMYYYIVRARAPVGAGPCNSGVEDRTGSSRGHASGQ
jgi:hypothetical protein